MIPVLKAHSEYCVYDTALHKTCLLNIIGMNSNTSKLFSYLYYVTAAATLVIPVTAIISISIIH